MARYGWQNVGHIILKLIEILSCQYIIIKFSLIYLDGKMSIGGDMGRGVGVPKFLNLIEIGVASTLIYNFQSLETYSNFINNVTDTDSPDRPRTPRHYPAVSGRGNTRYGSPLLLLSPVSLESSTRPYTPCGLVGWSCFQKNEVKKWTVWRDFRYY